MPSIDIHQAIQFIVILLISIDVHELAHAVTAYSLGDQTPKRNGQLSLNPFVHMDQAGVLILVISSLLGFPLAWGRTFIQPQSL
jgi:Zn-dependent protease